MSTSTSIPDLKRIQFFPGQRLTAQDLTDVQTANREYRWLHNRALHAWGIGVGYGVTGERGDTSVIVAAGYAIDCLGRELVLTEPVTLTIPAVAGISAGGGTVTAATFYLTATYMDDTAQSAAEERPGVCVPAGTVRLTEGPLLQWQQLKDVQGGINIILAQANVLNCQLNSALALAVRRSARPSQQPYIESGEVGPPVIAWNTAAAAATITTRVDTSAAKFQAIPTYFVHVMGSREITLGTALIMVLAVVSVSNPAPDGFNCDVMLYASSGLKPLDVSTVATLLSALEWTVVWMGVEG
ncbi:MAG: hypothetical protein QOK38_622 [Acidobacteriaceae bacterium]|jgi:hypothetical protein|nr:hypothetical protein [Acidobacteriaceae bacterium]